MVKKKPPIRVNATICKDIEKIIKIALAYNRNTNGIRKLDISGEVGEVVSAKIFQLKLMESGHAGFDAIDSDGKRVQIKTRRSNEYDEVPRNARVSKFRGKYDYALLVLLNKKYKPYAIWKANHSKIESILMKRKDPPVGKFISIAEKVFPR